MEFSYQMALKWPSAHYLSSFENIKQIITKKIPDHWNLLVSLLALASDGHCNFLKFEHHKVVPVLDLQQKVSITSQNHGFAEIKIH